MYLFKSGFFHLGKCICDSSMSLCESIIHYFSSLNSIPIVWPYAVCLFIYPRKGIWLLTVFRHYEKLLKHFYVDFV